MSSTLQEMLKGYEAFQEKYASGDESVMHGLSVNGQHPQVMVVACADSRVDPALILQCQPGDLFVVRNVANIIPRYDCAGDYHETSAALEYGVCYLNVQHLVVLGHAQCGGLNALCHPDTLHQDDFISRWVSLANKGEASICDSDNVAQASLKQSYQNCLSFPWMNERITQKTLHVHLWYFDIKKGSISAYSFEDDCYQPL